MGFDDALPDLATKQYGVAGRRQLRALGGTGRQIAHRVEKGILVPVTSEVLQLAGTPPSDGRTAMAAVLDAPLGAVLSHTSAAAWWDLSGFRIDDRLHVTVPRQGAPRRGRLSAIHHHLGLREEVLMVLRGIPVTSPALTMFHLAAILSLKRTGSGLRQRLVDAAP